MLLEAIKDMLIIYQETKQKRLNGTKDKAINFLKL